MTTNIMTSIKFDKQIERINFKNLLAIKYTSFAQECCKFDISIVGLINLYTPDSSRIRTGAEG